MSLWDRDLSIIPIPYGRKGPTLQGWESRRLDRQELHDMITQGNGSITGIGLVTGSLSRNIVCLDFDGDGWESARDAFMAAWPEAERAPKVRTGSGKLHIYLVCPDMPESFTRRVYPRPDMGDKTAIELRGNRCQTLVPPSLHPSGNFYEWIDIESDWVTANFGELRGWLEGWAGVDAESAEPDNGDKRAGPLPDTIGEGQRDTILTSLAGSLQRRGASHATIMAALTAENEARCKPPLAPRDIEKIARSVGRYKPAQSLNPTETINETDLGNARRLVRRHGENIRYCHAWGTWLLWRGTHWEHDRNEEIQRLARDTVASVYAEAAQAGDDDRRKALAKWALKSESRSRLVNMVETAKAEIYVLHNDLDADLGLLNCLNGTIDLRTGAIRPHSQEDLITKLCPTTYNPDMDCPLWEAFLWRIMGGNQGLIDFLQRAIGYSLTGLITEQCLFFMYGVGANGKSTFVNTIASMLGDYAQKAPTEMLMAKYNATIPNDIARLPGSRFVVAAEIEEGRRLAESLVKDLTGGDTMVARYLHQEFFEFKPTHKLWVYGNHKPIIKGTDEGIWRRMRLIPFEVTIPKAEQDEALCTKLQDELPGILAWAVRGCMEWQRDGLGMPAAVQDATQAYRAEMDTITAFLTECCIVDPNGNYAARASHLYKAYAEWCKNNGESAISGTRFGNTLRERGFNKEKRVTGYVTYHGIGLLDDNSE